MKTLNYKSKQSMIALFLMITMVASSILIFAPAVEAQTVQKYPTFLYAAIAPNPVGKGQPVTFVTWTAEIPPDIGETAGTVSSPSGRAGWDGMTVTIKNPSNISQTVTLPHSDPVGNNFYVFTPDTVGKYTFQTHYPDTWKNTTTTKRFYPAADSPVITLTVQEEPLQYIAGVPLPTEYWSRPIYAYDREWSAIAGNWITGLRDLPYISAPNRLTYCGQPHTASEASLVEYTAAFLT
jgi:hypothetical protein